MPKIIAEAFFLAQNGRPGPVLIDIPKDVGLEETYSYSYPKLIDLFKEKNLKYDLVLGVIPDDINFFSMSQQLDEGIRIISSIMNKKFDPELAASRCYDSYESTLNRTFKVFTSN